jgi:hypothetical protein
VRGFCVSPRERRANQAGLLQRISSADGPPNVTLSILWRRLPYRPPFCRNTQLTEAVYQGPQVIASIDN